MYFLAVNCVNVQPVVQEVSQKQKMLVPYQNRNQDGCTCTYLHGVANVFTFHQNVTQVFGAKHITQGGLCKEASGAVCIFHVGNGHGGIGDSEVNHSIHSHSHAVLCQDLEKNTNHSVGITTVAKKVEVLQ